MLKFYSNAVLVQNIKIFDILINRKATGFSKNTGLCAFG